MFVHGKTGVDAYQNSKFKNTSTMVKPNTTVKLKKPKKTSKVRKSTQNRMQSMDL